MKHFYIMILLLISLLTLAACGPSEDEVAKTVSEQIDTYFEGSHESTTHDFGLFDIYMPEGAEIVEEAENNLVIEDQNQTYILFSNNLEDLTSDSFYLQAKAMDNHVLLETYEDDERFGYIQLSELEDNYEVQMAVGGVRVTTHSSLEEVEQHLEVMSQMVNSIDFN